MGNRPAVTVLVVSAGSPHAFESAFREIEVTRVESASAATAALEDDPPAVLVVHDSSLDDGTETLLAAVRASRDLVPAVIVSDDPEDHPPLRSLDRLVVQPFEPAELREAVERARLFNEYDDAIERLFQRARTRATDAEGPPTGSGELQRLRREADTLLDDLVAFEDPDLLSALFWESTGAPLDEQ